MINYTDTCYFAETTKHPVTGLPVAGEFKSYPCRINYETDKVVDSNGQEVLYSAKIYLNYLPNINNKFKFNLTESEHNIKSIQPCKDVFGKVRYIKVFI